MDYSSISDALNALHSELAPTQEAFELIEAHCRIVADIAVGFANRIIGDADYRDAGNILDVGLVTIGGLAHDIGSYSVLDQSGTSFDRTRYILHGLNGYLILLDRGFGEQIAQFARNHTGVGITSDDVRRQGLPLPVADYVPQTVEQEIVMYADKFHTKSQPPKFLTDDEALANAARFGDDNARRFLALRQRYGLFADLSIC